MRWMWGFVGLLGFCLWFVGCQPRGRDRYLPSGWKITSQTTQLLARSYPRFDWMTLILSPNERPHRLFVAPLVPLLSPVSSSMPEERSILPRFPWQKASTTNKMHLVRGFSMSFRNNREIALVCRLEIRSKGRKTRYIEHSFVLPRSPRRWINKTFLWSTFRLRKKYKKGESIHDLNKVLKFSPLHLRGGIEFWEAQGEPRKHSVTLTLRGPFALPAKPHRAKRSSQRLK